MSIATLFGEMQATAQLHDARRELNNALSQRYGLANRLSSDLLVSRDVVLFSGQVVKAEQADWKTFYRLDKLIALMIASIQAKIVALESRLDFYKRMRERERISTENSIQQGNVFG